MVIRITTWPLSEQTDAEQIYREKFAGAREKVYKSSENKKQFLDSSHISGLFILQKSFINMIIQFSREPRA
jgi:hypothetical protein